MPQKQKIQTDNERLKARGIFWGGIGLLLFGVGSVIGSATGIAQSWYMGRHFSTMMPPAVKSRSFDVAPSVKRDSSGNIIALPK